MLSNVMLSRICHIPLSCRCISTTTSLWHNRQAGRYQISLRGDKPLTYEQANPPYQIGHRKTWNSWNTGNILGHEVASRRPETQTEDFFIRKFMQGTWHRLFLTPVIIKRRGNVIIIGGIVLQAIQPRKIYFLIGYTEELLSYV